MAMWPPLRHGPEHVHHRDPLRCRLMPPGKSVPEGFTRVIFVVFLFHLCAGEKQLTNDGGGCNVDQKKAQKSFCGNLFSEVPGVTEHFLLPSIGTNLKESHHQ